MLWGYKLCLQMATTSTHTMAFYTTATKEEKTVKNTSVLSHSENWWLWGIIWCCTWMAWLQRMVFEFPPNLSQIFFLAQYFLTSEMPEKKASNRSRQTKALYSSKSGVESVTTVPCFFFGVEIWLLRMCICVSSSYAGDNITLEPRWNRRMWLCVVGSNRPLITLGLLN